MLLTLHLAAFGLQAGDHSGDLPRPTEEELATACEVDLRPLLDLAEAVIAFDCGEGSLQDLRLSLSPMEPEQSLDAVLGALGIGAQGSAWVEVERRFDEDTGTEHTSFQRLQAQGFVIAGGDLVVSSRDGRPFRLQGAMVSLDEQSSWVDVGPFARQQWQEELPAHFVSEPLLVHPDVPWPERIALGDDPMLVFSGEGEESTLWLDSFGTVIFETWTRPGTETATFEGDYGLGCRTTGCVTQAVDWVLGMRGMRFVQNELRTMRFGSATGRDVVVQILREYRPWLEDLGESVPDRAAESMRVQSLLDGVFRGMQVGESSRVLLANAAHAIWIELNLRRGGSSAQGPFLFAHPTIGWSLDDYDPQMVRRHLLGKATINLTHSTGDQAYHFLHYAKAAGVLQRMYPYFPGQLQRSYEAIPRLLEFAADNQIHWAEQSRTSPYMSVPTHEYGVALDLAEGYQRRGGGCGLPSFMVALLARALNLPASAGFAPSTENGVPDLDGHRHVFFPTMKAWVHGDALATVEQAGLWGDRLLRSDAEVALEGWEQHMARALDDLHEAIDDLEYEMGLQIGSLLHHATKARTWRNSNPHYASLSILYAGARGDAQAYLIDRLGILGGAWNTQHQTYFLDEDQFSLLDQVAVHLPLEGQELGHGRVVNPVLRTPDGTVLGSPTAVPGRRGNGVRFPSAAQVDLGATDVLARTNEEMGVSVHYWPDRSSGAVAAGTLVRLRDIGPGNLPAPWSLDVDALGVLSFSLRTPTQTLTVRSSSALQGAGPFHVVATYSFGRRARLFVDGVEVASAPLTEIVALGSGTTDRWNQPRQLVPTSLRVAGNGFAGTLDELVVLFGEVSSGDLVDLATHF